MDKNVYICSMNRCRYDKKQFVNAVKNSFSIAEDCRQIGIKPVGGNYGSVKNKIKLFNLDTSHFTGQGWNTGERYRPIRKSKPLNDVLVISNTPLSSYSLKRRLFNNKVKTKVCEICGNRKWLEKDIPLELHHINGDRCDNRIENLQILCPNCHAQTENFRGRNNYTQRNDSIKRRKEKLLSNTCEICEAAIHKRSHLCSECSHKENRKVKIRPQKKQLIKEVMEIGYSATGRKYGVSDNAIRKWLK